MFVFCESHPLVAWVRLGSDSAAEGVEEWLRWLTERLRAAWADASDALANFMCRMKFRKMKGFSPVDTYTLDDVPTE